MSFLLAAQFIFMTLECSMQDIYIYIYMKWVQVTLDVT